MVSALGFGLSRTLGLGDPVPFTVVLAVPQVGACCMQSLLGSDPVSPCSASLALTFLGPVSPFGRRLHHLVVLGPIFLCLFVHGFLVSVLASLHPA